MNELFCVTPEELRSALKDIEAAENNGFKHCLSVFRRTSDGKMLDERTAEYIDLDERAHPTDGSLKWGRGQWVTRRNTFDGEKLIPIDGAKPRHVIERVWEHAGSKCVVAAMPIGHRCGYVGVSEAHPLFGVGYDEECDTLTKPHKEVMGGDIGKRGIIPILCAGDSPRPDVVFDAHGGLTYSGDGNYPIDTDEPLWWFGFDCGHCGDAQDPSIMDKTSLSGYDMYPFDGGEIRTTEYVVEEVNRLAEQLSELTEWKEN